MNKHSGIRVLVIFCILAFLLTVSVATAHLSQAAAVQLKLSLLGNVLGMVVSLLAAVLLLMRAAGGSDVLDLLPLTLPLLAGVLISGDHWSAALALALLGIAVLARNMIGTPQERRGRPPPTEEQTAGDPTGAM